eukprot:COSAG01_NODE_105_length_26080_cov_7.640237_16_plen_50_part_00
MPFEPPDTGLARARVESRMSRERPIIPMCQWPQAAPHGSRPQWRHQLGI